METISLADNNREKEEETKVAQYDDEVTVSLYQQRSAGGGGSGRSGGGSNGSMDIEGGFTDENDEKDSTFLSWLWSCFGCARSESGNKFEKVRLGDKNVKDLGVVQNKMLSRSTDDANAIESQVLKVSNGLKSGFTIESHEGD